MGLVDVWCKSTKFNSTLKHYGGGGYKPQLHWLLELLSVMLSFEMPTFTIPYRLGLLTKIEHINVVTRVTLEWNSNDDLMSKSFKWSTI
jgi:hypothetical protein